MSDERFHVYMMATRKGGPIYTGITNDLFRRVHEHKSHVWRGFTAKYNVDKLVWCEPYDNPGEAIAREKQLKKWRRAWKVALIEEEKPDWRDLAGDLLGQ
ncbi:GIY-YIG nuclease family protein [Labrys monachus]|uniref:Endonuclease n=1 Tax=Labrys monachus TaxID=217067 RepID=A0ABU0FNJ8_9HYPH|nr:GIY-YIG nuclease family protein [Labrys monachus]MDQ0396190.1 putative endonuclease [Labrys monachus]